MRLPRLFPRRRDPHTALITGIKASVRGGNTARIRKELLTRRTQVGLSLSQASELALLINGRVMDSLSHEEASSRLISLAEQMSSPSVKSTTWFTLENLSRTIGCFHASHSFTRRGLDALALSENPAERMLSALHWRDLDAAIATWQTLKSVESSLARDAGHYLWLWSGGTAGQEQWSADSAWSELLSGHKVVLLGPAPTSLTTRAVAKNTLVGRVLMQDVTSWDKDKDPLAGQCDVVWVSRETRNWIRDNDGWRVLDPFTAVSFRVDRENQEWPEIGSGNFRAAHNPSTLMVGGSSPNMMPLMVWDVLKVDGASLTVGGTTFFASQTAYTDTNRRFKHTLGRPTDETGSTGELFERCPTFARHNVTENLTLVANLALSGAIQVDKDCRRVVELDVVDYLSELDALYGVERR